MVDTFNPTDIPSIYRTALLAAAQVPATNDLQKTDALNLLMRQWVAFVTAGGIAKKGFADAAVAFVGVNPVLSSTIDGTFVTVDATGGALNASLPDLTLLRDGFNLIIQKIDVSVNSVSVTPFAGQTINGAASLSLDARFETAFIVRTSATTWSAIVVQITERGFADAFYTTIGETLTSAFDGFFISDDATAGANTVTLPDATAIRNGFNLVIQKSDVSANAILIAAAAGDTINGGASISLAAQFNAAFIVRAGANSWQAITIAASVAPVVGQSTVCYVDPAGNNATGTRGDLNLPFLTIAAALAASSALDTIVLAPGNYTENVTWLEQRSLSGAGVVANSISGVTPFSPCSIAGTFTLTAGITAVTNYINVSNVAITGAVVVNLAAKSGGNSTIRFENVYLASTVALTRRAGGNDRCEFFDSQVLGVLTSTFDFLNCYSTTLANAVITNITGSAIARMIGCKLSVLTLASGAGGSCFMEGCDCSDGAVITMDCIAFTATGCNLSTATLVRTSGTWETTGCSLTNSRVNLVGGAGATLDLTYDKSIVLCTANNTITLPAVAVAGQRYTVKAEAGVAVTVARNGNSIDGVAADRALAALQSEMYFGDGTNWWVI